jgi:signal transduction histidine kinase
MDRSFALTAADQCAQALDRVLAHARAERAAARTAQLQEVAAALSEACSPGEVVTVVATLGCAAVGAPRAVVAVLDAPRAALEVLQAVGFTDESRTIRRLIPVSEHNPLTEAARSGSAVFVETTAATLARYPEVAPHFYRDVPERAFAALPLTVHGGTFGTLGLAFDQGRRFDDEERAFLLAFARLCAQALDRARAYEAEASARVAADAANEAKDAFLSTLSHELRTPLTSILGWASILRTRPLDPQGVARGLAIIERNARTQVQLIEDILDVSRIVAGKLRLAIRPVDAAAVVRAAVEVVRPAAEAKRVRLEAVLDDALGALAADPERLQQIAWNLLTNAVKFTPSGGTARVRLDRHGESVRLQVEDDGEGIDAAFLPSVFDRFRQADASPTRSQGGLGLGLAIVKHLVELHGGTITAASAGAGRGATFTVLLPAAAPAMGDHGAVGAR